MNTRHHNTLHELFATSSSVLMIVILLASGIGVNPVSAAPASAPSQQSASWLDPAWLYRRPIAISNSGSVLTDYQVLITLDGSFNFALANGDGSDLRFTTDAGLSLPYWIETWNPGANLARIWIRVPSLPTAGATIYLYYGNTSANSASSGTDTFTFFDDAWTGLSKWHVNGGSPAVNNGIVRFSSGATMQTNATYSPGHALGFRGWFKSGGGAYKWGGFLNTVNPPYTYIGTIGEGSYPNVHLTNNVGGTRVGSDLGLPIDDFHVFEEAWTATATKAFLDHAATAAGSLTTLVPTTSLPI